MLLFKTHAKYGNYIQTFLWLWGGLFFLPQLPQPQAIFTPTDYIRYTVYIYYLKLITWSQIH